MRRSLVVLTCALSWSLALVATPASAQEGIFTGMQAGVDSLFSSVMTTVTFASGAVAKTTSTNMYPTFTLNINTMLFPGLRLSAGDVLEINSWSTGTDPLRTTSTTVTNRPFFLLRSMNPVLAPGVGYFRRAASGTSAGLPHVSLVNDEYSAYLNWHPEGGPRSDFQFIRTNTYDGDRVLQDITKDFGSLISQYTTNHLGLYYRGSYLGTKDRRVGLETRQISNSLRADYSQSFFKDRLAWNVSGNANRHEFTTITSGPGGEVALPVTAFAGLAAISDAPVTTQLTANGALIDGNLTASAGVNLGVPATPVDGQMRNIGLDLLTPTPVSRFWLWVDRELPIEIARSFSWEIYSSTDNVTWTREATVPVAAIDAFEYRFEIDFPSITARYVKAVVRPLSAAVQGSSGFRDIFVTELQAFIRQPASAAKGTQTRDNYLFNTDVRMRLLDAPALYYEGYYLANGNNGFDVTTDTLSNGLSISHTFGRMYSATARVAREQGREARGDRDATISNATFTVQPFPTLRSSLLYSGMDERVAGLPSRRYGVFLQNAAQPYRGVDVIFGIGWTSNERETGEISRDRLVNVSATVTPRQHVSLTLNYDARVTRYSGTVVGDPRSTQHRSYAALALDPVRTLHLVLGGEVIAVSNQPTRTTLDIGTSWTPFQGGALQFIFAYDEALRALQFGRDRNTLAAVRWNMSRRSYVDVSFQRTRNATELLTTQSKIFSVRVRLFL